MQYVAKFRGMREPVTFEATSVESKDGDYHFQNTLTTLTGINMVDTDRLKQAGEKPGEKGEIYIPRDVVQYIATKSLIVTKKAGE
jgi:hypothetical protein